MNNNSNKLNNVEKHYKEIFVILYKIIEYYENRIKSSSKKIFLDKYSLMILLFVFVIFSYCAVLIIFNDFWINQPFILLILSIIVLLFIVGVFIIEIVFFVQDIKKAKKFPKILLKETCKKGIEELNFCYQLSKFDKLALEYTENRLELLIENRKIGEQKINNFIALFGLGLAVFIIYQYKPENLKDFNTLSSLIILGGALGTIITKVLKAIIEFLDNKTIYQKCLAIIQYAKVLENQFQPTNITYLPTEKQKNKDTMASLRETSVDQSSNCDHNS